MILGHSSFKFNRETRAGNNLYQELSFQDTDALADIDEGADLTGNYGLELNNGLHSPYII